MSSGTAKSIAAVPVPEAHAFLASLRQRYLSHIAPARIGLLPALPDAESTQPPFHLGMVPGLLQLAPKASIGHIGLYRDEQTLNPVRCFNWAGEYGDTANLTRGQGENASIISMIDHMHTTHSTDNAKVFMTNRSQAVRLPKEYQFDTDEVFIRKVVSESFNLVVCAACLVLRPAAALAVLASSASRIALIMPSIIPDGAIISTPACAASTTCFCKLISVSSLSTSSCATTPQ